MREWVQTTLLPQLERRSAEAAGECLAAELPEAPTVVVGCSGGADSLALVALLCDPTVVGRHSRAATGLTVHVHAVIVDHQLQPGSAAVAQNAARQCRALGATAEIIPVAVSDAAQRTLGVEGAARAARYQALGNAAARVGSRGVGRGSRPQALGEAAARAGEKGAAAQAQVVGGEQPHGGEKGATVPPHRGAVVLVGHTLTDQAETVMLALARSSGLSAVAGMLPWTVDHPVVQAGAGALGRPLLGLTRSDTRRICEVKGLSVWDDPHNTSPEFLRSALRTELMPKVREVLGAQWDANLAHTAAAAQQDEEFLTGIAREVLETSRVMRDEPADAAPAAAAHPATTLPAPLRIAGLAGQPWPILQRVLREWLRPVSTPSRVHYQAIGQLLTQWHGQGPVAIPAHSTDLISGESTSTAGDTPILGEVTAAGAHPRRLVVVRRGPLLSVQWA